MYVKNIAILNTGYDVVLHDKCGNTYSQWTVGFILYCYIILLYNFNSLIYLTGIVEVVTTCSRQPKIITCSKNTQFIIMMMYHYRMFLTESQINNKQFIFPSKLSHLLLRHLTAQWQRSRTGVEGVSATWWRMYELRQEMGGGILHKTLIQCCCNVGPTS